MWDVVNSMLVSWIFNYIRKSFQSSIGYVETEKAVRNDLKERFGVGNVLWIYQLKNKIS